MSEKSRDGEFIGSAMSAGFLKETIDLTNVRGYSVLVRRVTSPDEPDSKAVYNLYQMDFHKGKAAPDLYEACKAQHEAIDLLFARLCELDHEFLPSKSGKPWEAVLLGNKAIAQADGK
jgi:hypothetical protein